jgi:hypothetical protein
MRKLVSISAGRYGVSLKCEVCGAFGYMILSGAIKNQEKALASVPGHHWQGWYLCNTELCPTCHPKAKTIGGGHPLSANAVERLKMGRDSAPPAHATAPPEMTIKDDKLCLLDFFTLRMLPPGIKTCEARLRPLETAEALNLLKHGFESAVGYADSAAIIGKTLGLQIPVNRTTVRLQPGARAIVVQSTGPRMIPGATELPAGARIDFVLLEVSRLEEPRERQSEAPRRQVSADRQGKAAARDTALGTPRGAEKAWYPKTKRKPSAKARKAVSLAKEKRGKAERARVRAKARKGKGGKTMAGV